jgi:hypothetical protein
LFEETMDFSFDFHVSLPMLLFALLRRQYTFAVMLFS